MNSATARQVLTDVKTDCRRLAVPLGMSGVVTAFDAIRTRLRQKAAPKAQPALRLEDVSRRRREFSSSFTSADRAMVR